MQGKNSMQYWASIVGPGRATFNFLIIYLNCFNPSLRLKNALYRLTGMKVGRDVSVGLMAMFDIFFPQLISVGDNTIIGYNCTVLAHEFLRDEWRTGRVEIGSNVTIGANCTILPGVKIGDGAVVSAHSLVNRDVEPGSFVGGVPIRPLQRATSSISNGNPIHAGGSRAAGEEEAAP